MLSILPHILYGAIRPGYSYHYYNYWWMSPGEWHAWNVMRYGNGINFGITTGLWLLAYIRRGDHWFQRLYYRGIAWATIISWIFGAWATIAFIIGGLQDGGRIGWSVFYAIIYLGCMAGLEWLAYWFAPRAVKFYKWNEQPWWNYNSEDAPDNWPDQLADWDAGM